MFESFFVALRVVAPMALLMGLGALIRGVKLVDRSTMRSMDKVCFRIFLPALLFKNIYETDLSSGFSWKEPAFILGCLLLIFCLSLIIVPRLIRDHNQAASVNQAIFRCNYILFGLAVAESIYGKGNAGTIALLGAIVVPALNVLAVVVLEMNRAGKIHPGKILLSVLKNPLIIATLLALLVKAADLSAPDLLYSVVKDVGGLATPLSFLSLGVSLDLGELRSNRFPLLLGVAARLVLVPLIFLPLAVLCGFRGQSMCAMMVFFAAPVAVSSYPMAVAMGADGQLSGQLVCCTTLLSVITIFCYTFLLNSFGFL